MDFEHGTLVGANLLLILVDGEITYLMLLKLYQLAVQEMLLNLFKLLL
jgi:hypothetical protein